ncbi:MAG: RNA methyltransferase [Bacteroidales bacterium]|nr:RNA methyltransferase [Bacteroidales bacterium]
MPQPITAVQRKLIASLRQSRHRRDNGLFVLEGTRSVLDSAAAFKVKWLVATDQWLNEYANQLPDNCRTVLTARNDEMRQMSSVVTPQGVLAVCRIPPTPEIVDIQHDELILALDCIQDPGNLGTIMRIADWFGIKRIIASPDTVDIYNPKVINATMGAIARVGVIYTPLPPILSRAAASGIEIYGTFLEGEPIHSAHLTPGGIIVMGNEGNGISRPIAATVTRRITIPSFPKGHPTVESLNVGVATAITVAEFRTRLLTNGQD